MIDAPHPCLSSPLLAFGPKDPQDCRDDGERLESVKNRNVAQVDLIYNRL